MDYSEFEGLDIEVSDDHVAFIRLKFKIGEEGVRRHQHRELTTVWRTLDADPNVRSALITGPDGADFYLSGKPPGSQLQGDALWNMVLRLEREGTELVMAMAAFGKPLVGAILGSAAGAGLATALMTDISIVADNAVLFDPHTLLGIGAGDGACALWPFYTGMPKAKLYMLTSDGLTGAEAERIGLVSRSVPEDQVLELAWDYARRLAAGPPNALRYTKRALNQWYKLTGLVAQDYSMSMQLLSEFSGDRAGSPYGTYPPRMVP